MTVATTASAITAQGSGGNFTWPFPFKIPGVSDSDKSNVVLTITSNSTSPSTIVTVSSASFTVTGINADSGSATYPVTGTALPSTAYLTIQRVMPVVQGADITNQSGFYLSVIERALDYITMLEQNFINSGALALRYSQTDPSASAVSAILPAISSLAGQFLAFDASGNPIASPGSPGTVASSVFMQTVLGATNSAAANALLGTVGITSFTAKGDMLIAPTASSASALVIGGNGYGIVADSTSTQGAAWRVINIGGINGLFCNPNATSAATKLDIAYAGAVLRNTAGGIIATNTAGSLTVDITTSGPVALGRDTSSAFAVSSSCYFYLIGSPTTVSAISSANSASPTLPTGYSVWQLAAAIRLVTASQILNTYVRGKDHLFAGPQIIFSTTASSTAETTASLTTTIPPIAQVGKYIIDAALTSTGGANSRLLFKTVAGTTAASFAVTCDNGGVDSMNSWLELPYVTSNLFYNFSNVTNITTLTMMLTAQGYTVPNGAS